MQNIFLFQYELNELLAEEISIVRELTKGPERELRIAPNTGEIARSLLDTAPKGRLLTPEEGCGYSKVQNKRIIGGSEAKNGKKAMSYAFDKNFNFNFQSKFRSLAMANPSRLFNGIEPI